MNDGKHPDYLFSTTDTSLLLKIVRGELDSVLLAMNELTNRGLDKDGKWIGFDQAKKHWDVPE